MDLSDLNKGVYFIRTQSKSPEYLYSGKLVIID